MKKIIASVVVAFALAAVAAPEKIASVQISDVAGVVSAASKLGEFTGNAMLGAMAAAQLAQNPFAQFFGPGRDGASTLIVVFHDGPLPDDLSAATNGFSCAFVYPVTRTKAQFLENFPEAKESDGVIAVNGTGLLGKSFVTFTADGKWAVAATEKAVVAAALKEIGSAAKPLGASVLRVRVTAKGVELAVRGFDKFGAEMAKQAGAKQTDVEEAVKLVKDVYGQFAGAVFDLGVTDKGLDIGLAAKPRTGTDFDAIGRKLLPADPLAFAGKDSFLAVAAAEDAGQGDSAKQGDAFFALLAKYGLDTKKWLSREKTAGGEKFTLDFDGAVSYFKGEGAAAFGKIDPQKFMEEFSALSPKKFEVKGPAYSGSFALKGETFATSAAERFAKILPEAAAKKPYAVQMLSLYALARKLAPKAVELADEDERQILKPMLAALPPAGEGGTAVVGWREKDVIRGLIRVSPDEIRGISSVVNVGMGFFVMRAMSASALEMDDADDDPDDDED